MRFSFVLVEPLLPENVGSCARAIKTMGFDELRLVNSCAHQGERAKWLAYGSGDILENASMFSDLASAVADSDLVIGTTARPRKRRRSVKDANDLVCLLKDKKKTTNRVALVFGREDRGLTNEELDRCDMISSIPLRHPYPSLNLAQAVLVYAYELSALPAIERKPFEPVESSVLMALKHKLNRICSFIDIMPESTLHQRLTDCVNSANDEEIQTLFSLARKIEARLDSSADKRARDIKPSMTIFQ